ncbi:MAG: hypothetical protein KME60_29045 [Cyanomargarita calcarea GSE-NOS-MK-12-04C]|jgi:hypothetical protein|uniref:Uncharacterized protein n=1 Tax=Cyanomargarita calcarea GSE-NOS-MK-12-04C TaxID=2839659 RepID=A0A951QSJ6_9CYAN|nr:hypothetical protein [Cyanomargarita calcarea GSE-NOS-MK-12-04C]
MSLELQDEYAQALDNLVLALQNSYERSSSSVINDQKWYPGRICFYAW